MKKTSTKKIIAILGLALLFSFCSFAASSPITAGHSGKQVNDFLAVTSSGNNYAIATIWQRLKSAKNPDHNFSHGHSTQLFWAGGYIKNTTETAQTYFLEVRNPHIDTLVLYTSDNDGRTWKKSHVAGDYISFRDRPVHFPNIVFPVRVNPGDAKALLFKIDKQNASVYFPIYCWSQDDFHRYSNKQYAKWGIYYGILLIIIMAVAIVAWYTRQMVYVWYLFYLISMGMYLLITNGLAYQVLYPDFFAHNNAIRTGTAITFAITFIKFNQSYFDVKVNLPKINFVYNILWGTLVSLCLLLIIFPGFFFPRTIFFLQVFNTIVLLGTIATIYTTFALYNKFRLRSQFFLAALACLLLGVFLTLGIEYGLVDRDSFPLHPIQLGSLGEILVLTVAIGFRVKQVFEEKVKLDKELLQQRKQQLQAYIDGTEKERNRIAMELHDDIASRLSNISRNIASKVHGDEHNQLTNLAKDVRNLSHELSPITSGDVHLERYLQHLIEDYRHAGNVQYELTVVDYPDNAKSHLTTNIYRIIQEAIINIEKHSQAGYAEIQVINHSDEIVVTIEDNGKGFCNSNNGLSGIGLKNMHTRVKFLEGSIDIDTAPGRGTSIAICIPAGRT